MEAWIARRLSFAEATKEGLECALDTQHDILQDLAVDLTIFRQGVLDIRQFGLLLIVGDSHTAQAPRFPAFLDCSVVDVPAEHGGTLKHPPLTSGRLEFVF